MVSSFESLSTTKISLGLNFCASSDHKQSRIVVRLLYVTTTKEIRGRLSLKASLAMAHVLTRLDVSGCWLPCGEPSGTLPAHRSKLRRVLSRGYLCRTIRTLCEAHQALWYKSGSRCNGSSNSSCRCSSGALRNEESTFLPFDNVVLASPVEVWT